MQKLLLASCVVLLCGLLTLGLWPFHSPRNDVAWMRSANGLAFHREGTAYSTRPIALPATQFTLEVWARPSEEKGWGTLLDLRNEAPGNLTQLTLSQLTADLEVRATTGTPPYWTKNHPLEVLNVLSPRKAVFITMAVGPGRIHVYIDGALVKTTQWFPGTNDTFLGQLIVGDSSGQSDGWNGDVGGVAIYGAELSEAQTHRHYSTWKEQGGPHIFPEDKNVALYLLDQRAGRRIPGGPGPELFLPETYTVLQKQTLGLVWEEYTGTMGYWADVRNNIVGFIPFGFLVYGYLLATARHKRAVWLACTIGFSVSLLIELLQLLLPTRESSSTDLCLNTLGTYLGVISFQRWGYLFTRLSLRWFPARIWFMN